MDRMRGGNALSSLSLSLPLSPFLSLTPWTRRPPTPPRRRSPWTRRGQSRRGRRPSRAVGARWGRGFCTSPARRGRPGRRAGRRRRWGSRWRRPLVEGGSGGRERGGGRPQRVFRMGRVSGALLPLLPSQMPRLLFNPLPLFMMRQLHSPGSWRSPLWMWVWEGMRGAWVLMGKRKMRGERAEREKRDSQLARPFLPHSLVRLVPFLSHTRRRLRTRTHTHASQPWRTTR